MMCSTSDCCDSSKYSGRNFLTKEEKIEKLGEYKGWLDNESKGVQEKIEKLKAS